MRVVIPLLLLTACAPPQMSNAVNQVSVVVAQGPDATTTAFVSRIDEANDTLKVALPMGMDLGLSDAIIMAADRGVEVEVVTDIDQRSDPAIVALADADIPLTYADGELAYFDFSLNKDLSWTSDQAIMSHAFVISDRTRLLNSTLVGASGFGGTRVLFDVVSEDAGDDLTTEHRQVYGGSDAVELDAYSAPGKSVADYRWRYPTQTELDLQIWLGPQERLTKRVIDAVYSATSSVWVLTNDFANDGLSQALQTKAEWGFEIKVVVGPAFGESSSSLAGALRTETPDVEKRQITGVGEVPTVVLIDYLPGRDGLQRTSTAMVISHDLYSATRVYRNAEVVSDQIIDGNLFQLSDPVGAPSGDMLTLQEVWKAHYDQAEAL